MNDYPEKRRSKKLRLSNEENMKKMIIHREVEKQRRQEMVSLYAALRSLLPLQFIQGKRSTSDQVTGAVNYIEYLQRKIKDMSAKKEIVFSVSQTPFSSVLQVLHEKGLCVIGCISSTVNDRLVYTLQAEVNDLALTDLADLKDTLTLMK